MNEVTEKVAWMSKRKRNPSWLWTFVLRWPRWNFKSLYWMIRRRELMLVLRVAAVCLFNNFLQNGFNCLQVVVTVFGCSSACFRYLPSSSSQAGGALRTWRSTRACGASGWRSTDWGRLKTWRSWSTSGGVCSLCDWPLFSGVMAHPLILCIRIPEIYGLVNFGLSHAFVCAEIAFCIRYCNANWP